MRARNLLITLVLTVAALSFFPDGVLATQLFEKIPRYLAGPETRSIVVGDLDGNGSPDLATANYGSDDVSVLLNNGDGTFAPDVEYAAGDGPVSVALGDLDGDGSPDLATANWEGDDVSVFLGNGDGTFSSAVNYPAGAHPGSVAVGDLDGDGHADLAVTNWGIDEVGVPPEYGDVSVFWEMGTALSGPRSTTPPGRDPTRWPWGTWTGTAARTWPWPTDRETT